MRNTGLGSWPIRRARMSPDQIALIHEHQVITYSQLATRCTQMASQLLRAGISPGDRVAYLGPNHPAFVETMFATHLVGGVFVPLNFRLSAPEIAYMLSDCGAKILVYAEQFTAVVRSLPETGVSSCIPVVARGSTEHPHDYESWVAAGAAEPIDMPVWGDDIAFILYTSGTTGRPKGAMLSHANLLWNTVNLLIGVDVASDDVALIAAPLFHTAALGQTLLPTLIKGAAALITSSWDVDTCFDLIEKHRVTWMFGVPTMFAQLAHSPRWHQNGLSSLRTVLCGGAAVPVSLIDTYQQRGLAFCQGYGMTESSPGATLLEAAQTAGRAGSAGPPVFFCDIRVARADLSDAATGEPGEVLIKGPNVTPGYWNNAEATADAITPGGWLRSGDIGTLDDDGHLHIVDRIKDMFISGGENVYPAEVEGAIFACPQVAEVAVVGVPDIKWGEVGHAYVVAHAGAPLTAETLRYFLSERLAKYKIPVHYHFVEHLAKTGSGKTDKRALRQAISDDPMNRGHRIGESG
jgi:fatty-acyl-CoA synthase